MKRYGIAVGLLFLLMSLVPILCFAEEDGKYIEKTIRWPDGNFYPIRIDPGTGKMVAYFQDGWQPINRSMESYLRHLMQHQDILTTKNFRSKN